MQDLNCAARASVMKKNPPRVKRCVSTTSRQINSQILVSSAGINLLFNTNFFAGAGSWGADVDVGWLSSGSTPGRKRGRDWNGKSVCGCGWEVFSHGIWQTELIPRPGQLSRWIFRGWKSQSDFRTSGSPRCWGNHVVNEMTTAPGQCFHLLSFLYWSELPIPEHVELWNPWIMGCLVGQKCRKGE